VWTVLRGEAAGPFPREVLEVTKHMWPGVPLEDVAVTLQDGSGALAVSISSFAQRVLGLDRSIGLSLQVRSLGSDTQIRGSAARGERSVAEGTPQRLPGDPPFAGPVLSRLEFTLSSVTPESYPRVLAILESWIDRIADTAALAMRPATRPEFEL